MMTLSEWIADTKTTQAELARQLGTTQGYVSKLVRRTGKPSIDVAVQIERVTGGKVPASTWATPSAGEL